MVSIQPKMWLKITTSTLEWCKSVENWVVVFKKTQPNVYWCVINKITEKLSVI